MQGITKVAIPYNHTCIHRDMPTRLFLPILGPHKNIGVFDRFYWYSKNPHFFLCDNIYLFLYPIYKEHIASRDLQKSRVDPIQCLPTNSYVLRFFGKFSKIVN